MNTTFYYNYMYMYSTTLCFEHTFRGKRTKNSTKYTTCLKTYLNLHVVFENIPDD